MNCRVSARVAVSAPLDEFAAVEAAVEVSHQ